MTLYLIGVGLGGAKDLTLRGLEALKNSTCYLENYTSIAPRVIEDLEGFSITAVHRSFMEEHSEELITKAKNENVAVLVIGHPLAATTHVDLLAEAKKQGVQAEVIHNASIFDAISLTGLQLYKFGKTTSIPFTVKTTPTDTPARVFAENQSIGAHTLFLLDLHPKKDTYFTIKEALEYLQSNALAQEHFTENTLCIGCARLGTDNHIVAGTAEELKQHDFGNAPYCLIVPGNMHFMEEETLQELAVCYSKIKTKQ